MTERNKPIALIQKIEAIAGPVSIEARLAKAAAEGIITLPTRKLRAHVPEVRTKGKISMAHAIVEEREDRF